MPRRQTSCRRRPLVLLCLCVGLLVAVSLPAVAWGAAAEGETPPADISAALANAPGFSEVMRLESGSWRDLGAGGLSREQHVAGASSQPAEVIVQFGKGADTGPASKAAGRKGARLKEMRPAHSPVGVSLAVYSSDTLDTAELTQLFEGVTGVVAVAPNSVRYLAGVPDDLAFSDQWALENTGQLGGTVDADIDASAAWDISTGSSDVVVAVIDTGVDYANPDLAANMWHNPGEIAGDSLDNDGNGYVDDVYGIDAKSNDSDPNDTYGHGTAVAGVVAAVGNNGLGTSGVAWTAKIMALRAGDQYGLTTADVIECIEYAIDMKLNHGVNVVAINASFVGNLSNDVEMNVIQAAGNAGIVLCAAAGNATLDSDINPRYPASYSCSNIISIGASDPSDEKAYFSNYGATSVDLFAPGVSVLSTAMGGGAYDPGPADFYFDDVEYSGAELPYGGWMPDGSWAITTSSYESPTHSWTDSAGQLSNDADVRLTSPTMDLSRLKGKGPRLGFSCQYSLEADHDFTVVEVSGDGGSSWTVLGGLTGTQPTWGLLNAAIPDSCLTESFKLRFRSITDSAVPSEGFAVDDVGIEWPGCTTMNGTSFSAPHVAGSVALLAAVAPWQSMSERIGNLLSSVDQEPALSGLCVTGGRLNVASALRSLALTTVEQDDAGFKYSGGWTISGADPAASGGTIATTRTIGSSVSVAFTGTSMQWRALTTPWYGKAKVVLDAGTPDARETTVDLWSPAMNYRRVVYSTGVLKSGAHTVSIYCTGERNPYSSGTAITADCFEFLGTPSMADPAPPLWWRNQETDPKITYLGNWSDSGNTGWQASGNSFKSTSQPGATVVVKFTGTAVTPVLRTAPWYGQAKLTLDPGTAGEQTQIVDLYSSSVRWMVTGLYSRTLTNGPHTLVIENASTGKTIGIDAFDITGYMDQAPAITKIDDKDYAHSAYSPGIAARASTWAWSRWDASGYWAAYQDTYAYTDRRGNKMTFTFDGTHASWVAATSKTKGKARVTLDMGTAGQRVTTVDLYSPTTLWKRSVYSTGLLPAGIHTIQIECLYQKNPAAWWYTIDVDRFEVLPSSP